LLSEAERNLKANLILHCNPGSATRNAPKSRFNLQQFFQLNFEGIHYLLASNALYQCRLSLTCALYASIEFQTEGRDLSLPVIERNAKATFRAVPPKHGRQFSPRIRE